MPHLPPGWRDEWTEVLRGAANDEYARDTAERLGWSTFKVTRHRKLAEEFLGVRTLPGALWKAKELGIL